MTDEKELATNLATESHDPAVPEAYSTFMRQGWGGRDVDLPAHPITDHAAARRRRLAETFPGERLVLPAGTFKVRSYDTDYRFRPDTAHTYFSGNQTSDAVLVIDDGEAVLYARPSSTRDTDEFFRDRMYGELWVGRRPSLKEISDSSGLEVRHLDDLPGVLRRTGKTRVHRGVSTLVDAQVSADESRDGELARVVSEMRLVKDDWEVGELQDACDITALGFADSVGRVGPRAGVRRALDRGHVLPPRPRHGQRHRLRLHRRRRHARHHAALDRQHRPDHARHARAARHGRRGPQPLHRRRHPHPARRRHASPRSSATSTPSSTTPRRPASRR